jgi:hypothetical protein
MRFFPPQRPRHAAASDSGLVWHGLLLALFLLIAQSGVLAHDLHHLQDVDDPHEPVCEMCLAYAAVGTGAVSTPVVWVPPPRLPENTVFLATTCRSHFQPTTYRSRASPLPSSFPV